MNFLYRKIATLDKPIYPPLINGFEEIMHSVFEVNQPSKPKYDTKAGPRGVNVQTPYTTWHGHTRIRNDGTVGEGPLYVGVQWDGWVCYLWRDGRFEKVQKLDCRGASDFTFSADRKVFYVVDSLRQRVLKVDRNSTPWAVSTLVDGFVSPVSIREINGLLYVTDKGDGTIWTVTLAGVKTKLMDQPGAFWVDHFSNGDLAVATLGGVVRRISPAGVVLQTWITLASQSTGWTTVSVDRNGTFGPADEFAVIVAVGMSNVSFWRLQGGVLKGTKDAVIEPTGGGAWGGNASVGNTRWCQDPIGHYPWVAEHHPDEAVLLVQGIANVFPSLIAARPANYPAEDAFDLTLFDRGREIIRYGVGPGSPYFEKPSFTTHISEIGWSLIGATADWIAVKSYADAASFVQQGMFGSFPRPEIKGKDLLAILYVIYRSSQRFLKEGKPLIDGLRAFCAPLLGQELPTISHVLPVDGDLWLDFVDEGANLRLKASTHSQIVATYHASTIPVGLVVRVFVDEGLPEQQDLGTLASPWVMPKPILTGQHSLRCKAESGVTNLNKYRGWARRL
jgi:hypothetical protein